MAVPPHLLKNISRQTREHTERKMTDRLRWSQLPVVPVELLEHLIDEKTGAACSDEVRKQVVEALKTNRKRWPGPAQSIKVSQEVKYALDSNPELCAGSELGDQGMEQARKDTDDGGK